MVVILTPIVLMVVGLPGYTSKSKNPIWNVKKTHLDNREEPAIPAWALPEDGLAPRVVFLNGRNGQNPPHSPKKSQNDRCR